MEPSGRGRRGREGRGGLIGNPCRNPNQPTHQNTDTTAEIQKYGHHCSSFRIRTPVPQHQFRNKNTDTTVTAASASQNTEATAPSKCPYNSSFSIRVPRPKQCQKSSTNSRCEKHAPSKFQTSSTSGSGFHHNATARHRKK